MIGRTISHYLITQRLGAGGMGEIYRAQDTRLNRAVVIKVLAAVYAGADDRRRRFLQEAQAASALNHPNIITIHDIVSEGETEFLVMEFVAGKTLGELIPVNGLTVPLVIDYALQMASALEAAHGAGIIHRDLKPGNVMVTDAGLVKILDFGLAKLTAPAGGTGGIHDETRTLGDMPLTVEGSIMGTLSYMSPEQAEGKPVDARSDIFAMGAILHEMITGQRAFRGESPVSTLTSILRDEVRPLGQTTAGVPPELESLVARCLRKNREQRWQSMRDMRAALALLKRDSDTGTLMAAPPVIPPAPRKSPMLLAGAAVALVVAAAAGWWTLGRGKPAAAPAPPVVNAPAQVAAVPPPQPAPKTPASDVLTNDTVLDLMQAGVAPKLIIDQIRSSATNFDLSTPEIIRLTKGHVPTEVVQAMRNPKAPPAAPPAAPPQTGAPHPPAQSKAPAPSPPPPAPLGLVVSQGVQALAIPDGMPVALRLTEDVPLDAPAGKILHFTVTKEFRVGNAVVLAEGASAMGEVVALARKKQAAGGHVAFRMASADTTGGGKLALRATPLQRGEESRRPMELPNTKRPKNLAAAAGASYIAYVQGDQTVAVKK